MPSMLKPADTVSIAFVHGMLSGIVRRGENPDGWLSDAGIPAELLRKPAARVTAEQYVALFTLLMDRRDDEFLGLLSRPLHRGTLALMIRSTLKSTNLAHALKRFSSTFRLLQDDVALIPLHEGRLFGLRLSFRDGACSAQSFLHELQLRVFWRVIVWLHGDRLKPARFDFAFATPPYADEYARVFPGLVQFEQPYTTLWFDEAKLNAPMLRDEHAMHAFLAQAPGIVISPRHGSPPVSARVRAYLQVQQPHWPDLTATAGALHLSTSTLQRRLAAEGISFQSLKDQLRCDMAIVRLSGTTLPLATVASELGFADSPAFQRAFKVWTGSPPGVYRREKAAFIG